MTTNARHLDQVSEMGSKGHAWKVSFLMYTCFLASSASQVLDTFKDVKLDGCTCSLTMVLNDDGIVDVKNAACNKKCTKKSEDIFCISFLHYYLDYNKEIPQLNHIFLYLNKCEMISFL